MSSSDGPGGANQQNNHHRVDYIEMMCKDIAVTKAFYATVFGWRFTDYGPGYTSFADGRLSGGFRTDLHVPPATAACLVVIYSTDLDATRRTLESAGAKPFNFHSFPGGKRFHFHDPSGNELAVWSDIS